MGSLGALAIGLSVVFVAFLLLLVAELYYLLFWKKRNNLAHRIQETALLQQQQQQQQQEQQEDQEATQEESFSTDTSLIGEQRVYNLIANRHQSALSSAKLFQTDAGEIGGTHYLMGPPRFLFTIREETKEELESETAARSRNGSVDFALIQQQFSEPGTPCETPFATPPSSPSVFSTPPGTPSHSSVSGCSGGGSSPGIRTLAREPPMHCTIFIPSPQGNRARRTMPPAVSPRTTMMMLLVNPVSPPGTPPTASPNSAAYRTPPTHLYSPYSRSEKK